MFAAAISPVRSQDAASVDAQARPEAGHPPPELTLEKLYEDWHDQVQRWVSALGGPQMDRDDVTQDVFISARKRLASFDGKNLPGWLFAITKRRVIDHQRGAWFKHVFSRRDERALEELPAPGAHLDAQLELHTRRRVLHALLDRMSLKRRTVFVLFEIEGLSGEEIATLEQIPVNTVWTRLHHARRDFFAMAAEFQKDRVKGGEPG
ncbi:MAG: RNA polymerase sigma factor [Deltaproteobacteria bacterium]|nr:RNA polymerase sigma factor [Deltaproteobacteria bacterium]